MIVYTVEYASIYGHISDKICLNQIKHAIRPKAILIIYLNLINVGLANKKQCKHVSRELKLFLTLFESDNNSICILKKLIITTFHLIYIFYFNNIMYTFILTILKQRKYSSKDFILIYIYKHKSAVIKFNQVKQWKYLSFVDSVQN